MATRWEAALDACDELTDAELLDVIDNLIDSAYGRGWRYDQPEGDDLPSWVRMRPVATRKAG